MLVLSLQQEILQEIVFFKKLPQTQVKKISQ